MFRKEKVEKQKRRNYEKQLNADPPVFLDLGYDRVLWEHWKMVDKY